MSKVMGIYVKFTKTTHQIWSCHVTLASNSENFYLSPNSILRLLTHVRLVRQNVLILSEVSLYVERSKSLEKKMLSSCKKIHLPEGV